ncbi:hypothetical protein M0R45_015452 [Rubus argutus]|uniref:Nucleic acid binding protein n=1 Tax=Rubus argutus TaxID=59490 RepID=A0AAW1XS52_RUBAR
MHAMWVLLKENVKCGNKLADVVGRRERCNRRFNNSGKAYFDGGELVLAHGKETRIRDLVYRAGYTQAQLCELDNGDPSRNIIEMIVRRASMNPSKPLSRIRSVLRVNNSIETLERFEKYRENVKTMAKERYLKHPRSTVDGNELLRFYGTTMACCNGESKRVLELCKGPTCGVCRLIQSHFDTECRLKNGIQMSTSSENTVALTRASKTKRAVIVCRTIAGSIVNMNDGEYEESDLIGNQNLHCTTTEYLTVPNPSAVLPCFVIVFN